MSELRTATMSKADVAKLLAMISSYDQRTVGAADVEAWHQVALHAHWTYQEATSAVVTHHTNSTYRILPAHITTIIRGRRPTNPWVGMRFT